MSGRTSHHRSRNPTAVLIALGLVGLTMVLLGVVAGGIAEKQNASPSPAASVPALRQVFLKRTGPRTAEVLVDGESYGPVGLGDRDQLTGRALIKLTARGRLLGQSRLEIRRDPAVPAAIARGVQGALTRSGAANCALIEPE